jgi:hypothetical protein
VKGEETAILEEKGQSVVMLKHGLVVSILVIEGNQYRNGQEPLVSLILDEMIV